MRRQLRAMLCLAACMALFVILHDHTFAATTWPSFRGNDEANAVVAYETPTEQDLAEPAWVKQFGEQADGMRMWNYTPNVPIIVNGDIITTSGKTIVRLDAATGAILQSADLNGAVNWGYTPLTYVTLTNGTKAFLCPLAGGIIEAVNADTFEELWTFRATAKNEDGTFKWGLTPERDKKEGEEVKPELITEDGTVLVSNAVHQSLSPIAYKDGILYTGFFAGSYDYYDYYVAIAAEPVTVGGKDYQAGELIWKYKSKGGFYWNGAQTIGNAVIVGTQDGVNNNDVTGAMSDKKADSHLLALDLKTGAVITDVLLEGAGDICSSIVWDKDWTGRLFWSSCCGMIHSAKVDKTTGEVSDVQTGLLEDAQSLTVNTPVIYNGRVYLGYKPQKGAYGYFAAYDADTLENCFRAELRGYPKGSPVITTAYETTVAGRPETGWLYAYISYYQEPGGVQVIKFKPNATNGKDTKQVVVEDLFDANGYEQYAACSMVADDRGQLYYKNDSNTLFAIKPGSMVAVSEITGVKLTASGTKVTVKFNDDPSATQYRVLYRLNNKGAFVAETVNTNKCVLTVPNSSAVTVRIRAEYVDAAKVVSGDYSSDVTIYTAKSTIKKLTAAKKAFTVKYDRHKNADGYQIQYSLKKTMKSAKVKKVTKDATVSLKVKKLKSKKTYYVRVRSYRSVNGKPQYGKWSAVKKVKVK